MPIGGFVVAVQPDQVDEVRAELEGRAACEVHGTDEKGNIVTVLDTETGDAMDEIVRELEKDPRILSVGLAYLNAEDEVDRMIRGEAVPDWRTRRRQQPS